MIISQAPPATTTTTTLAPAPKPILPSISEPEYRNLFASVNSTFTEILLYEIETLLPEDFAQAYTQFESAKVNYETQIWRWPYDGEAAYPFSDDLRNSGKSLNILLEKGLPLRSDAEKAKVGALADKPRPADLPAAAAERLAEADAEFAAGKDFHTEARYRSSIASFKRATLLYESADARAEAEVLKSKVDVAGYGKYSPHHQAEADQLLQEDASLYALSNNDAILRGADRLEKASLSYENIFAWGAEREAMEARDRVLISRRSADWLYSELNAAEEYSAAVTHFSDAEGRLESSHFDEATALYDKAAVAFEIARLGAGDLEYSAKAAFERASQALADQKNRLKTQKFEEDANFLEAEVLLASADNKLLTAYFAASHLDSMEALNQIAISDGRFQTLLREQEAAREAAKQSEADRLASEISAKEEVDRLAREAQLIAAEAQAAAKTTELAASAAELAAKSAELEALRSTLARTEAEIRAKAEKDAVEKAALERQAAEVKASAQAAALAAAQVEAARLAAEQAEAARLSAEQAEANHLAAEQAESARLAAEQVTNEATSPAILSGIEEYAALPAAYIVDLLPERKGKDSFASIAGAEYGYNDARKWTILYEANKSSLWDPANPNLLRTGQVIVIPSIRGEIRSGTWDPGKTYPPFEKDQSAETEILDAIDQARNAYDKAVARNARNNYPALLAKGAKELEASRQAFDSGDSLTASAKAESARVILEGISEFAPLPATYKIGMVPERKNMDNLWSIAASPFGYNDPYKWTILYKANKTTLPDPSNPNLLRPGQVIKIPSIGGELREGSWDPKKTYPPRAKR